MLMDRSHFIAVECAKGQRRQIVFMRMLHWSTFFQSPNPHHASCSAVE
jgi:hypothetical protein